MSWKTSFYLFFFGILTLVAVFWHPLPQKQFSTEDVLGAKTNIRLFIEPDDGRDPVLSVINSARHEVLVQSYLLSDQDVISALTMAKERGVTVQVMLEEHPFGGGNINTVSKPALESGGIEVRWGNPAFRFTHIKMLVVDGEIVCVLNMNLSKTAFDKNREFNACDENKEDAVEAQTIFKADWDRTGFSPTTTNLVISPENARGKLTTFISSATQSIDIEMEVLQDDQIMNLLAEKAKTIPVRIIVPPLSKVDANKVAMENLGAKVVSTPYIHAKMILVDNARVYLGSVNLSAQSMEKNRELGIIIAQPDVVSRISQIFESDWLKTQ